MMVARLAAAACLLALPACSAIADGTARAATATANVNASGIVPWIATAVGPPPTPTPSPEPTPIGLPQCRSAELRARVGFTGAGASNRETQVVFTNHGAAPCALTGFPARMRLLDGAGRVVTEYRVSDNDGGSPHNGGVAVLPGVTEGADRAPAVPGQAVLWVHTTPLMCGHASVASVDVTLVDGVTFRVPVGFGPDTNGDCVPGAGVFVSSFQAIQPTTPQPSFAPDLEVAYQLPSRLQPGSVLSYTVTLTNVSGYLLTFDPCPGYTEGLKAAQTWERHLLNCAAVPWLATGAARTFAMEMAVPSTQSASGPRDILSWFIDPPYQSENQFGPGLTS